MGLRRPHGHQTLEWDDHCKPRVHPIDPARAWGQRYAVITVCRTLLTLETAQVASMPGAVEWALQTLEPRWQRQLGRLLPTPSTERVDSAASSIRKMAALHFTHRDGQSAFRGALDRFVSTAESLNDYEMLATSRCYGWAVLDVLTHVRTGIQEMLGGFTASTQDPADQDAASYWLDCVGDNDPVNPILWTRRTSTAYRRPSGSVQHLRMAANAVHGAADHMPDGRVSFQNHTLTSGDFLATWAVELAVHQVDLGHTLDVADPTPESVSMIRRTVEALLDTQLPADWSDLTCVLLGTGRRPPSTDEVERLGSAADRLPVLG